MKIKKEKEFTLPLLIEWAWNNPDLSNNMSFFSNGLKNVRVNFRFNPRGVMSLDILNGNEISNDTLFSLEENKELTEDTVFKQIFETDMEGFDEGFENVSINDVLSPRTESLVVMDKHLEPVTIWTNTEGLVKKDVIIQLYNY